MKVIGGECDVGMFNVRWCMVYVVCVIEGSCVCARRILFNDGSICVILDMLSVCILFWIV